LNIYSIPRWLSSCVWSTWNQHIIVAHRQRSGQVKETGNSERNRARKRQRDVRGKRRKVGHQCPGIVKTLSTFLIMPADGIQRVCKGGPKGRLDCGRVLGAGALYFRDYASRGRLRFPLNSSLLLHCLAIRQMQIAVLSTGNYRNCM